MDNDSFSVTSNASDHSSTNEMDCDEQNDTTDSTTSITIQQHQQQLHQQHFGNDSNAFQLPGMNNDINNNSSNNNEESSSHSIVNIADYGYVDYRADRDDGDQNMDNNDLYPYSNNAQQHLRNHQHQPYIQQQQQHQQSAAPPVLPPYYGSNHRPQQHTITTRNWRNGNNVTNNSNSPSSFSSSSLAGSNSLHASGTFFGGGRTGVPFVPESTVALLDSAAATMEAISQLTLQRTTHSTASSISTTTQAVAAAAAAAAALNHVLSNSVHTANSSIINHHDDSTDDLGYEPCVPQERRGSMTLNDEKQRRASIQAVMADKTLSPLSKRKSIQSLMDGRRRSMTHALPSNIGTGTAGVGIMMPNVNPGLPPRFGNRRNSMSGFTPSNQNSSVATPASFASESGSMYGQQNISIYSGVAGAEYGITTGTPFGRNVVASTGASSCSSSLRSSGHSPARMRGNNTNNNNVDRISTLGYDGIILESNTTGDSSDSPEIVVSNILSTRNESHHSAVSGTTINSSIHSHGFGLGGSYHNNNTLDGSSFHRAYQNSIDGNSFHQTHHGSIDGNSFHRTHHSSLDGNSFHRTHHNSIDGSSFHRAQHNSIDGSSFHRTQHSNIDGSSFHRTQHNNIDGNSFHRTHHNSIDGNSFHRTHHNSIDGNSFHRTHQNSIDGSSFHNTANFSNNRKNSTTTFQDSFNSDSNPYEYNTPSMMHGGADTTCTTVLSTGTNSTINADNSSHYSSSTNQQQQQQQPRYHFIQQQQHVHQVNQQQPYFAISNDYTRETEMNRPPCTHYERNCTIIAACCGAAFGCRLCHDESTNLPPKINNGGTKYHRSASLPSSFVAMEQDDTYHTIDRFAIAEIICRKCFTRQSSKSNNCIQCNVEFGQYHCTICNLWMSNEERPYHCEHCGFCRVGGAENFQHCHRCGMCIDIQLLATHNCKADKYRSNCPVCQEYLFSSRGASHEMPCGHPIHWECFRQLAAHDSRCPICKKTAVTRERMIPTWSAMATSIALQPIPPELARVVSISCNDCESAEDAKSWHFLGMQCIKCQSFNTVVDKIHLTGVEAHEFLETNAQIATAAQQRIQSASTITATTTATATATTPVVTTTTSLQANPQNNNTGNGNSSDDTSGELSIEGDERQSNNNRSNSSSNRRRMNRRRSAF